MGRSDPRARTPPALRRRDFLAGTLAAAGAIAAGAEPARAATAARTAGGGPVALSARRAATYRALVAALRHAPDGRFRHARPRAAAAAFGRWYAGQADGVRRHADAVLDLLRAAGPLHYDRLAHPVGACADAAGARHRAAVAAGVALAAVAIAPPPPADERPVVDPLPTAGAR